MTANVKILSSGNPQIAKGYGDGVVQRYIAAMPGWKSAVGRRIDQLVMEAFPAAEKAVKWNTALFGKEDGWFMALYCYRRYVQLTFMQGSALDPVPPVPSKSGNTRYLNIHHRNTGNL